VPTVAESGVPGYDVSVWWGFLGTAKMPAGLAAPVLKAANIRVQ
jgi:tripartite-type tricarboxylate transporter receptor subunit TctC